MTIIICISVFIIGLAFAHDLTAKKYQKRFDEEMAECCKKYDCIILQLNDKYMRLDIQHEKLQSDHERVLKDNHDYEKRFKKFLIEKADIQYQASKFQKELFAARKRIRKILGSHKK